MEMMNQIVFIFGEMMKMITVYQIKYCYTDRNKKRHYLPDPKGYRYKNKINAINRQKELKKQMNHSTSVSIVIEEMIIPIEDED